MQTWLIRYLVVTGLGAFVALSSPGLVTLGFFLFILPGLILSMMPTAFLWGVVFALIWWPLKGMIGEWPAVPAALAGAFAILWLIPATANAAIDLRIAADRAGDRERSEPIPLRGVVRIETTQWSGVANDSSEGKAWFDAAEKARRTGRPFDWENRLLACDALCAAALFTPGVEAVILVPLQYDRDEGVRPLPKQRPAQFRIDRSGRCRESVDVGVPGEKVLDGWPGDNALQAEWRARISAGECIVREAPDRDADFTITVVRAFHSAATRNPSWAFADRSRRIFRLAIADRRTVLFRQTMVETTRLAKPLYIDGTGGIDNYRFRWGIEVLAGERQAGFFQPFERLKRLTPLDLTAKPGEAARSAREQLAALLKDPARPASDPGFLLPGAVIDDIEKNGFKPGDADLIQQTIEDPRTRNFDRIGLVIIRMGADSARLRGPIVNRLLRGEVIDYRVQLNLGRALAQLPPGIFAKPTPDELALLADPERSRYATGLIRRQTDRGAKAVPLLLDMLEAIIARRNAIGKWSGPAPEDDAMGAINQALAVLGPEAAFARPRLEAALESQQSYKGRDYTRHWEVTLIRMGRSPDSFEKPLLIGGTEEEYHRSLRRDVDRFERDLERNAAARGVA